MELIAWTQILDLTFSYAPFHHTDFGPLFLLMKYLKILILTFTVIFKFLYLRPNYRKDQNFRAERKLRHHQSNALILKTSEPRTKKLNNCPEVMHLESDIKPWILFEYVLSCYLKIDPTVT